MTRRTAFTLVELMVVVAILMLLVGILAPVVAGATRTAKRATCLSNIRQLAAANIAYASSFGKNGTLCAPAQYISSAPTNPIDANSSALMAGGFLDAASAPTMLLCPMMEKTPAYKFSYSMNAMNGPDANGNLVNFSSATAAKLSQMPGNRAMLLERDTTIPASGWTDAAFGNGTGTWNLTGRHDSQGAVAYFDGHSETVNGSTALPGILIAQ